MGGREAWRTPRWAKAGPPHPRQAPPQACGARSPLFGGRPLSEDRSAAVALQDLSPPPPGSSALPWKAVRRWVTSGTGRCRGRAKATGTCSSWDTGHGATEGTRPCHGASAAPVMVPTRPPNKRRCRSARPAWGFSAPLPGVLGPAGGLLSRGSCCPRGFSVSEVQSRGVTPASRVEEPETLRTWLLPSLVLPSLSVPSLFAHRSENGSTFCY